MTPPLHNSSTTGLPVSNALCKVELHRDLTPSFFLLPSSSFLVLRRAVIKVMPLEPTKINIQNDDAWKWRCNHRPLLHNETNQVYVWRVENMSQCSQAKCIVHIYHHITKITMPLLISNWLKQEPSAICPPWVASSKGPNQVNWAHWHTKEINKKNWPIGNCLGWPQTPCRHVGQNGFQ